MKRVRRMVFERNGQKLILQGIVHALPDKSFYRYLSREMETKKRKGFLIFREGVRTANRFRQGLRGNALLMFDFLEELVEEARMWARQNGHVIQKKGNPISFWNNKG